MPQATYHSDRGDLAWIDFDPQAGCEQAKNRPALILTNREFNVETGLLIACPITRTDRTFGSRVKLAGIETAGFVMVEQVKSVDWRVRGATFIEAAPPSMLQDVKLVLGAILDF